MRKREAREFDVFVHTVGAQLLHAADLLTGDRQRAERRVERALAHTCLNWGRLPHQDPVRTAWRALLAGYLDPWRPGPRGYRGPGPADGEPFTTLDRLGRVERATVVLRWYARLDEHDAAEALGLPVETVAGAWRRGIAQVSTGEGSVGGSPHLGAGEAADVRGGFGSGFGFGSGPGSGPGPEPGSRSGSRSRFGLGFGSGKTR